MHVSAVVLEDGVYLLIIVNHATFYTSGVDVGPDQSIQEPDAIRRM